MCLESTGAASNVWVTVPDPPITTETTLDFILNIYSSCSFSPRYFCFLVVFLPDAAICWDCQIYHNCGYSIFIPAFCPLWFGMEPIPAVTGWKGKVQPRQGHQFITVLTHMCIWLPFGYRYSQFTINQPNQLTKSQQVLGMREEARLPGENPCRHRGNIQTRYK